jgi:hypothetical protein
MGGNANFWFVYTPSCYIATLLFIQKSYLIAYVAWKLKFNQLLKKHFPTLLFTSQCSSLYIYIYIYALPNHTQQFISFTRTGWSCSVCREEPCLVLKFRQPRFDINCIFIETTSSSSTKKQNTDVNASSSYLPI